MENSAINGVGVSAKKHSNDRFYEIIVNYTHFENDELVLDYQYFKNNVVDSINWLAILHCCNLNTPEELTAAEGVTKYNMQNNMLFSPPKLRMITLIMELYLADGGKTTIAQINNKVMNLRTKNTLPFTYLYKTGVIEKALAKKKRNRMGAGGTVPLSNTNLKKKNQNIIKALNRFYKSHMLAKKNGTSDTLPSFEFTSEPEKWIAAMLRKHGKKMANYLHVCVTNIVDNFILELETRGMWNELQSIRSYDQYASTEIALNMMTQIVSSKAGNVGCASSYAQAYYSTKDNKQPARFQHKHIKLQSQKIRQAIKQEEPSADVKSAGWLLDEMFRNPVHLAASQAPYPYSYPVMPNYPLPASHNMGPGPAASRTQAPHFPQPYNPFSFNQ
ncbi:hypothetical protein GGF39_001478 [Coemansia sp. RSA 1721]|nr:hypothetical protein GGF39_001478 [Coemansia sp. RSA 1721]